MRITGGTLRGRRVPVPPQPGVRPSSARLREALFSIIGQDLAGITAVDAFGGSGLLALEACSRGAGPVTVIERSRRTARGIAATASSLGVSLEILTADAGRVLPTRRWDLVLMDPPYADRPVRWLSLGARAARETLVMELHARHAPPTEVGPMVLVRHRKYGSSALAVYRVAVPADETQ